MDVIQRYNLLYSNTPTYATPFYTNSEIRGFSEGESPSYPEHIDGIIEEVIDIAKQLNLEVDADDFQELLDSHNQELTIDELIEIRGHDQDSRR